MKRKRPRKKDPTSTLTIRRRANREINRRFKRVRKTIIQVVTDPRYGLFPDGETTNILIPNATLPLDGRFQFVRESQRLEEFNKYMGELIDEEILSFEGGVDRYFLNQDIGASYSRGAVKSRLAAERGIPSLLELSDYNPFTRAQHLERAELIYTRTFEGMKRLTDTMKGQMNRVLSEGMIQGTNPRVIAREMAARVDKIGITRARLIARTEIVESHNEAGIRESELIEADTGVEIKMQWFTALDGRQRDTHEERHEKIYTKEKARELIGEPNCRCSVSPVFDIN